MAEDPTTYTLRIQVDAQVNASGVGWVKVVHGDAPKEVVVQIVYFMAQRLGMDPKDPTKPVSRRSMFP